MKQVYLKRAIIAGSLWLAMIALMAYAKSGEGQAGIGPMLIVLIPGFALAIMLGRAIMETVSDLTGLNFFFSGIWLLFFYVFLTAFSLVIAPLYSLWNLFRYFTATEPT